MLLHAIPLTAVEPSPSVSDEVGSCEIQKIFKSAELYKINCKLQNLLNLENDWDGCDGVAPSRVVVKNAIFWLDSAYDEVVEQRFSWSRPSVTLSSDGDVVFEWWSKQRKLTIYVSERNIEYLRVWGADINTQMSHGIYEGSFADLWNWLMAYGYAR